MSRPALSLRVPDLVRGGSMQDSPAVIDEVGRGSTLRLAFISAMVSLIAAFAAVGSTIPLFNIYRAEDGFTNAGISVTVVAYSAATLATLLMLGRLSNHWADDLPQWQASVCCCLGVCCC